MLQPRIQSRLRRAVFNFASKQYLHKTPSPHRPQFLPTRQFTLSSALCKPQQPEQPPPPPSDAPEEFAPKPLGRPIGFPHPPRPGENTGAAKQKKDYSGMTMSERNLAKRADLVEKWGTNYFRDFKNIRKYRDGKTFLANPRIFKRDAALFFPNLRGDTLEGAGVDTTSVLKGKVSVVRLYSSAWGEAQVQTFTSRQANGELHKVLKEYPRVAQQVDVNVEENTMKAWIVAMFAWRQRLTRKKEEWGRYFVVRKGVSQMMRESIGALNGRVGYVYLVDAECRIRWAGSANAEGTEKEDLARGFRKCVEEIVNGKPTRRLQRETPGNATSPAVEAAAG